MEIGLNGQKILIKEPAGPEKYTINLFKALSRIDHDNTYTIYLDKKPSVEFFEDLTTKNPNFSYKVVDRKKYWTQIGLAKELRKNPVDVFFSAVHTIPIMRKRSVKMVAMIHGLEYKYSADYFHPLKKYFVDLPEKLVCKLADALIVPSQATKIAIQSEKWRQTEEDDIHIVHEGVDNVYKKRTRAQTRKVLSKYALVDTPYIFTVSTIQPRKNYPKMIEGFSRAINENQKLAGHKLIIAGKNGWHFEPSLDAPEKYGVKENVIFLGRVPDEDLPSLYSGATAFVSTSLEEGFGLPLIEALASEIPTIVSDIPAYREIGSNFPTFVNPKEVESIKEGFLNVLSAKPNKKLLGEGATHAKSFSWDTSAEKVLRIMKDVQ